MVGRLAPAGTLVDAQEDEDANNGVADSDESEAGSQSPIGMAMDPSSIGLSFVVSEDSAPLLVTARWGEYALENNPAKEAEAGGKTRGATIYRRSPIEENAVLDLKTRKLDKSELVSGIKLETVIRPAGDGIIAISIFLVNRRKPGDGQRPEDSLWIFQPELSVRSSNQELPFLPRQLEGERAIEDRDLGSMELLYWNRPEFAVGHGAAAQWDAEGRGPARSVWTAVIPSYELTRIDPREDIPGEYDMVALGGNGSNGIQGSELEAALTPLANEYERWIEEDLKSHLLPLVDASLRDRAHSHIEACEIACERIREGIALISGSSPESELARMAFCFAMRAMALQRKRSIQALKRRRGEENPESIKTVWRPFQLAFVLLNIPSLADRNHQDRGVADLLWFPTGGGKTEAYLGLTAFALAHRRTRVPEEGYRNDLGIAVIMRYTLRLLTIQQFQRATTLICACEYLRETEGIWGAESFSIGLWVGRDATPNAYDQDFEKAGAKQALALLNDGKRPRKGSPVQLASCPWCGAKLTHADYMADDEMECVYVHCPDGECHFSSPTSEFGLPVHVVDSQIFRKAPSLLIATVDKFAQMPWNGRVQTLFGRVDRECPTHGLLGSVDGNHPNSHRATKGSPKVTVHTTLPLEPPDLIIQDELHLISGPLGTLVGLYEAAVDVLASIQIGDELIPPKVIASTATIRRAEEQIAALFGRRLQVFPPMAIDAGDSFFGREVPTEDEPGRMYVGVNAPGKSVKTALVRVFASLLSRSKSLHSDDALAADPYMTLVGYFNSLRELGGAIRLIDDDVPGRIEVLAKRDVETYSFRTLFERDELTSNKRAEQIPRILESLERIHPAGKPPKGAYPIDTLFASNMISVGVDIDRLGLMVVNGQPKTTAEYIQATSRVGRQAPGLVVTVFNWTRPRDLSHYERFHSYHSTLYRFVEATSVTPFSARARDKGLSAVLTSVVRLGTAELAPEKAAVTIARGDARVEAAVKAIRTRAALVAGPDVGAETEEELRSDVDDWISAASTGQLVYSQRGFGPVKKADIASKGRYLLGSQEDDSHEGIFTAPGSLREVEGEIHIYLMKSSQIHGGEVNE